VYLGAGDARNSCLSAVLARSLFSQEAMGTGHPGPTFRGDRDYRLFHKATGLRGHFYNTYRNRLGGGLVGKLGDIPAEEKSSCI